MRSDFSLIYCIQYVSSFVLFIFLFLRTNNVAFSEYYVPLPSPFCMENRSTLYVFLPDSVFLPCDHGLDFDISYH